MGIKLTKEGPCLKKKTTLRLTKRKFQVFQWQKRGRKFQQIRDKSVLIQNTGEKVNADFFFNLIHDLSINVKSYFKWHKPLAKVERHQSCHL